MDRQSVILTIVSPVYNSADIIPVLVDRLVEVCSNITPHFNIVLVDDGSSDDSWNAILESAQKAPVIACRLRRNVGQHYAIHAGLSLSEGKHTVVMDCDLQDDPVNIPLLYERACSSGGTILAYRETKRNDPYYVVSSYLLNTMLYLLHGQKYHYRTGNFGVYPKEVVQQILRLPVRDFYLPVAVRTVVNRVPFAKVDHGVRYAGKSTYRFNTQCKLAMQALRYCQSGKVLRSNQEMPYSIESVIYPKFGV